MLDKMIETLVLLSIVFYDEVVCFSSLEQRSSNSILLVKMLLQKQGGEWCIDTFKLGIEGTVAKGNLGNDSISFDVIVIVEKLQIKDFDDRLP